VGREYQRAIFSRLVRSGLRVHQAPPPAAGSSGASEATSVVDEDRRKAFAERVAPLRTGSAQAKILDISISELGDQPTDSLPFRGTYQARVLFEVFQDLEAATGLTLGVTDTMGRQLVHFNSINHGIDLSDLRSHAVYAIDFKFESTLCPGEFGLISGIGRMSPHPRNPGQKLADNIVDYCVGGARFSVRWPENGDDHDLWGVVYVAADVQLTPLS
jgi:lipopolysaccharide transport system ATP-binding protein